MTQAPYAKMNGIGNSILVVDLRRHGLRCNAGMATALAEKPGLAFDQLMVILPPRSGGTDAFVDIFNTDGSRAGACGNGTRCVAWVMLEGRDDETLLLETHAGRLPTRRLGTSSFSVDMGPPRLGWRDIPLRDPVADTSDLVLPHPPLPALTRFSAVSMGNPHAVFIVDDPDRIDLAAVGPAIEHDPMFPDRVNVSVAAIDSRDRVRLRVWERGAGATLACGSAACATLVSTARAGLTEREAHVALPGGSLLIHWQGADDHVLMTGDVELEHRGHLPADLVPAQ